MGPSGVDDHSISSLITERARIGIAGCGEGGILFNW